MKASVTIRGLLLLQVGVGIVLVLLLGGSGWWAMRTLAHNQKLTEDVVVRMEVSNRKLQTAAGALFTRQGQVGAARDLDEVALLRDRKDLEQSLAAEIVELREIAEQISTATAGASSAAPAASGEPAGKGSGEAGVAPVTLAEQAQQAIAAVADAQQVFLQRDAEYLAAITRSHEIFGIFSPLLREMGTLSENGRKESDSISGKISFTVRRSTRTILKAVDADTETLRSVVIQGLSGDEAAQQSAAQDLSRGVLELAVIGNQIALAQSEDQLVSLQGNQLSQAVTATQGAVKKLVESLGGAPELLAKAREVEGTVRKMIALLQEGDRSLLALRRQMLQADLAARTAQVEARAAAQTMGFALSRLSAVAATVKESIGQQSSRTVTRMTLWNGVLLAVAVVVSIGLGLVVIRRITVPLKKGVLFAQAIANNDLTQSLDISQEDEVGQLAQAMNRMAENLKQIIRKVADSSAELFAAAEGLSGTTSEIAASNEQVSAQSQSVALAAEEMSATVQQVAQNSAAVNEASEDASRVASEGAQVISRAVGSMNEIARIVGQAVPTVQALGKKSEEISVVLEVIGDIADQTNLLALNAAIEAARAGEHGRGFAVVADEVRKLAEKTIKATQEIALVINSIQAESRSAVAAMDKGNQAVTEGSELADKAGQAIGAIEERVRQASSQTEQIATASEEMSTTIHDIAGNIEEVARGIAQNSIAAAELAGTAKTVASKAEELREITRGVRI